MNQKYRVAIQVSGGGEAGENVLWEGSFEELRAKYGDDPDANSIQWSGSAGGLTLRNVVQKETRDGWQECVDPRERPDDRSVRHETRSSDPTPMPGDVVPLHGLRAGEPVLEAGGLVEKTKVSLALFGDALDPPEITRMIGREPSHAHRRGEPGPGPQYKIPYSSGAWLLSVEVVRPEGPDDATERLLDLLPSDERLWKDLSARYDLSFSYGVFFRGWNRGFTLSPRVLQRLVTYRARLDFDLYANVGDPEGFIAP